MQQRQLVQPWLDVEPTGPFLRPKQAAEYIGVSLAGYYQHANDGNLPKFVKLSLNASGVPRPWLDAVIAARCGKEHR